MVNIDPAQHDLERRRKEQGIPAHLDYLPESAQLRIPIRNGYRARGVPELLRTLAARIEDTLHSPSLNQGNVAFSIHCHVRWAQSELDGKVKKYKG